MRRFEVVMPAFAILVLAGVVALGAALEPANGRDAPVTAAEGARKLETSPLPLDSRDERPVPVRPEIGSALHPTIQRTLPMTEVRELLVTEKAALLELRGRLAAASTDEAAQAVILEIGSLKAGTELEMLAIQLRHARKLGQAGMVRRLEEARARILAPPLPAPEPRPAQPVR